MNKWILAGGTFAAGVVTGYFAKTFMENKAEEHCDDCQDEEIVENEPEKPEVTVRKAEKVPQVDVTERLNQSKEDILKEYVDYEKISHRLADDAKIKDYDRIDTQEDIDDEPNPEEATGNDEIGIEPITEAQYNNEKRYFDKIELTLYKNDVICDDRDEPMEWDDVYEHIGNDFESYFEDDEPVCYIRNYDLECDYMLKKSSEVFEWEEED